MMGIWGKLGGSKDESDEKKESENVDVPDEQRVKAIAQIFASWSEILPECEDDDLGIMLGRIINEMVERGIENSENQVAIVRRLRRIEGIIVHLVAGKEHKISLIGNEIICSCGGLKIPATVPDDDKFFWEDEESKEENKSTGEEIH